MILKKFLFLAVLFTGFSACQVEPAKINYGSDTCDYCGMTIVDKEFAAQMVTDKGKPYKFDAVECLIHAKQENLADKKMTFTLIADYDNPGEFVDAEKATYLVSKQISSPMGANLAGFEKKKKAEDFKLENDTLYNWDKIQKRLKR